MPLPDPTSPPRPTRSRHRSRHRFWRALRALRAALPQADLFFPDGTRNPPPE